MTDRVAARIQARQSERHRVWGRARGPDSRSRAWQRIAALAVLISSSTAATAAASGASVWHVAGAAVYVALAVLALRSPNALTALVAGGLLLSGSLLIADDGPNLFAVLIMLMSVVATAELLGVAALLATPVERDARNDLRRAAIAVTIAGVAFGVMMLVSVLPVRSVLRSGIPAIAIASGACVLLAIVLVSSRFAPRV